MCTNLVDYSCQILTIFTPFSTNYHKEATTNTPSFDETDLSLLSLSKQLSSCQNGPKMDYSHLFYTLAVKIAKLNGVASHRSFAPIWRLPIMMLPW